MISGKTTVNQVVHNVPTPVNNQNTMNGIYSSEPTYPTIFANPITSYEYVVNITDDFECVWQGEIKTNFASTRKSATHKAVEKLFKVNPNSN